MFSLAGLGSTHKRPAFWASVIELLQTVHALTVAWPDDAAAQASAPAESPGNPTHGPHPLVNLGVDRFLATRTRHLDRVLAVQHGIERATLWDALLGLPLTPVVTMPVLGVVIVASHFDFS